MSGSNLRYRMGRTGDEEELVQWVGEVTVASHLRRHDAYCSSTDQKYTKVDQVVSYRNFPMNPKTK